MENNIEKVNLRFIHLHSFQRIVTNFQILLASSTHPAAYSARPAASSIHPAAYPARLAASSTHPAAYSALPAAYSPRPAAYSARPAASSTHPAASSPRPAAYSAHPAACPKCFRKFPPKKTTKKCSDRCYTGC